MRLGRLRRGGFELRNKIGYSGTDNQAGGKENDYSFPPRLWSSDFVIMSFARLQLTYADCLLLHKATHLLTAQFPTWP